MAGPVAGTGRFEPVSDIRQEGRRRQAHGGGGAPPPYRHLRRPRPRAQSFGEWWAEWLPTAALSRPSTVARNETYARTLTPDVRQDRGSAKVDHQAVQRRVGEVSGGEGARDGREGVRIVGGAMRAAVRVTTHASDPTEGVRAAEGRARADAFRRPGRGRRRWPRRSTSATGRSSSSVRTAGCGSASSPGCAGRVCPTCYHRRVDVAEIAVEVRGHHHLGPPKTKAGRRSVPLPLVVVDALRGIRFGPHPDVLVFPSPQALGLRPSLFRRRVWTPRRHACSAWHRCASTTAAHRAWPSGSPQAPPPKEVAARARPCQRW